VLTAVSPFPETVPKTKIIALNAKIFRIFGRLLDGLPLAPIGKNDMIDKLTPPEKDNILKLNVIF